MNILVIAEHNNNELNSATLNTLAAAKQLNGNIDTLIAGHNCQSIADSVSKIKEINKVIVVDDEIYAHHMAENTTNLVIKLAEGYDYILTNASTFGKNFMPRVAALLNVAQISDVITIKSPDTFIRPIYAGNALETVQSSDSIKLLTIRSTSFKPLTITDANVEKITFEKADNFSKSSYVREKSTKSELPELTRAKIIVSGGRGLASKENFSIIKSLAKKLNAAVGASRTAVDAGFAPNDFQIGQTGKIVAPDLYIAVGISGAIQHLAGMKESKTIVAINNDEDAPIFNVADYGIVDDLFSVVPELEAKL